MPDGHPAALAERVANTVRYTSRWARLPEAAEELREPWQTLASRSLEGPAFLAPWFVLPAMRLSGGPTEVLLVERSPAPDQRTLAGLLLLSRGTPARSLPLPHWQAWRSLHAYTTGALVDATEPEAILRCLLEALRRRSGPRGAIRFTNLRSDGALAALAAPAARDLGLAWFSTRRASRAAINVERERERHLQPALPGPDDLRRARSRLEARHGPLTTIVHRGAGITGEVIERHLRLEAAGWKTSRGTALLSDARTADSFREMARDAAIANALFFVELSAAGEVIASTSNFLHAGIASAFKVGWDPGFARFSPGRLVDQELARIAPSGLQDVQWIDSCADPGSHLERLWEDRIEVCDGYLAWGRATRALLRAADAARRILRRPG